MAANLFNIWNPHVADGALTFEITQADTFQLNRASHSFILGALSALGIEADNFTWEVVPGRAHYYSDDPNAPDWRDRWVRTWKVRVNPVLAQRANELFREPVSLGLSDDTWTEVDIDEDESQRANRRRQELTAFVIVDFREKTSEEIEELALSSLQRSDLHAASVEVRELAQGFGQLHAVIEGIELVSHAAKLEELMAIFRASGGATNWRHRLTWPARSAVALKPEMSAWLSSLGLSKP